MYKFMIQIGEHHFRLLTAHDEIKEMIEIEYQAFLVPFHAEQLCHAEVRIEPGLGYPTIDYKVEITSTPKNILYKRTDYTISLCKSLHKAEISVLNSIALKHALMNFYSTYITHHSWGLLVHSSCVESRDRAYLFAGPSGAGKSTVAKLSAPRTIWSDEASILKIAVNQPVQIFNSPFRSELKLHNLDLKLSCKLAAIYLLVQSTSVQTSSLLKSEAILQLTDKIFNWPYQPSEAVKVIRLCKSLVEQVPIYRLDFQKNDTFWELIS